MTMHAAFGKPRSRRQVPHALRAVFTNRVENDNTLGPHSHGVGPCSEGRLTSRRKSALQSTRSTAICPALRGCPAIANTAHAYAATEINKGAFRGVPALPAEDIDTLSFDYYLVAAASLSQRTVAKLARLLLEARRDLLNELPSATVIAAASTEKDALVPAHPGA